MFQSAENESSGQSGLARAESPRGIGAMADPALPPVPGAKPAGRTVVAETLAVAPEVLARFLAEPWRRAAAMAVDLVAVGLLSLLSGPWLALGTGAMLIVLLGNAAGAPTALKVARVLCRTLGAGIVVLAVLAIGHSPVLRDRGLALDVLTGRTESDAMRYSVWVRPEDGIAELRETAAKLERQVDALKKELRDRDAAGASWLQQTKAFAAALGVTFGWSGVYFTLLAGALNGRTPGKAALGLRAVKLNGQPFTFFDAFIRHGGYVAGVAMGLMGFLKVLWDPNRQAIEDRVAATVVVRGA